MDGVSVGLCEDEGEEVMRIDPEYGIPTEDISCPSCARTYKSVRRVCVKCEECKNCCRCESHQFVAARKFIEEHVLRSE